MEIVIICNARPPKYAGPEPELPSLFSESATTHHNRKIQTLSPLIRPREAVSDSLYYLVDIFEQFREAVPGEEGLSKA